jgi:hypothetical protein
MRDLYSYGFSRMMAIRSIDHQAERLEKEYYWLAAADSYERALNLLPQARALLERLKSSSKVSLSNMPENVTERGWFSYRYAVPGFVFVGLIFLLNLDVIASILDKTLKNRLDVAAIVALLTFLSGPAIGFTVTQLWYLLFPSFVRCWFWRRDVRCELRKKEKTLPETFIVDSDYWVCNEIPSRLFDYLTRRWDLFHLLCSTALVAGFGLLTGYLVRYLLIISSNLNLDLLNLLSPSRMYWVHVLTILVSMVLITVLVFAARNIRDEHQDMILRILRDKPRTREFSS